MTKPRSYANAAAFRRALTHRLHTLSHVGKWSLHQLQRQIAYDRLLQRLYLMDSGWIVKGAVALMARDIGVRGTVDMDLYRGLAQGAAEAELREAARRDI